MKTFHRSTLSIPLLILPAIALGIVAMIHSGLPAMMWMRQFAAWLLFAVLTHPLRRLCKTLSPTAVAFLLLVLLMAALFGEAVGGARRWVELGVLNINASLLALPAFIVVMYHTRYPFIVMSAAALILCIQPDPAQLCAFAAALLPLLGRNRRNLPFFTASLVALAVLIIVCLRIPTSIEPVEYCEGILSILSTRSLLHLTMGILFLSAIPFYLGLLFLQSQKLCFLSLAMYYTVSMLFILTGNDPVPFMGFGLSPIAGYFLAHVCIVQEGTASD